MQVYSWYNFCYTYGMKTAISIPDPIFRKAEKLCGKLGLSRSELYARAVQFFIKFKSAEGVTEALNAVYDTELSRVDPLLQKMQSHSFSRESW